MIERIPSAPAREVRVAPNIYKRVNADGEHVGWRVYVRRAGKLRPKRFKADVTLEELQHFVETFKLESRRLRRSKRQTPASTFREARDFRQDARAYLQLETVKAMPSYDTREAEIEKWIAVFGDRLRPSITTKEIDEQLQAFLNEGYSGSSVNKFRTALMSLWTKLDGRSAANPVKDCIMFDEAALVPRGQSYDLLTFILDSIPEERGRGVKGEKGSRSRGSESRGRLEILVWTGMDPSQLARMHPVTDLSIAQQWYTTSRQKGSRRRRTPRPVIRKPMSNEAVRAFRRGLALGVIGKPFSVHSLRHTWERGVKRAQERLRERYDDETFTLPHIRLKDIRHSFGTELYERLVRSKSYGQRAALEVVGQMLDHAPGSPMTLRYALKAVPVALQAHRQALPGRKRMLRRAK